MTDDTLTDKPKKEEGSFGNDDETVKHFCVEINLAKKAHESYFKEAKKAKEAELLEKDKSDSSQIAIYFSTNQTIRPSIFSQIPNPDFRRRFKDRGTPGKLSAEVLERAVSFSLDGYQDFNYVCEKLRDDYLTPGRALSWERIEEKTTYIDDRVPLSPAEFEAGYSDALDRSIEGLDIQQDPATGEIYINYRRPQVYLKSITEYVPYNDFLHNDCKTRDDLRWVARKLTMYKDEVKKRWPKFKASNLNYTDGPAGLDDEIKDRDAQKRYRRAVIWEIWNKPDRTVYFISPSYKDKPIEILSDPLNLEGFFPCPMPLVMVEASNSMLPIPEYRFVKPICDEIDAISKRINNITESIRIAGIGPKEFKLVLGQLLKKDNEILCPDEFIGIKKAGGLKEIIEWLDLTPMIAALAQLYTSRDQAFQKYYEITGYSDLMRGVSNPETSATAEDIKGQFASVRLKEKQRQFQNFLKEVITIKAEIIAEHFDSEQLRIMTGIDGYTEPITEQDFDIACELLKDDLRRCYSIDIETDSTVVSDERKEQKLRTEAITGLTPLLQAAPSFMAAGPEWAMAIQNILMWVFRSFKSGRQIEGSLEQALSTIVQKQQEAAANPPQPQPDPMVLLEQTKAQGQMQVKQAESQGRLQLEQVKLQNNAQLEQMKAQNQAQIENMKAQNQVQIQQMKAQSEMQQKQVMAKIDMMIEIMKSQTGIKLEEAQAQADMVTREQDFQFDKEIKTIEVVGKLSQQNGGSKL